jgi:tetratricopeptide (TPR) repeat protein
LLPSEDLVGLARTLRRAGALDQAATIAETAVARGGGASARRARGELAKARGDRARALLDFESLVDEVDDPVLRLELAKLYEHYVKAPALALEILERGTGEPEAALEKRRVRLRRKLEKPQRPKRARS